MDKGRQMGDYSTGTAFQPLQEVRAYWEGLREGSSLPSRAALDPRGMERALEHVFLIERIAHGVARFRLAGMHLVQVMGMEVRGLPMTALFDAPARDAVVEATERVFAEPAILQLALDADRGFGRPALEGRMLLLPVLGDDGRCDRALGCLVTLGLIGRSPRRFTPSRQVFETIDRTPKPVQPLAPRPAHPLRQPVSGFADQVRPYAVPDTRPQTRSKAHLRLVKSDD